MTAKPNIKYVIEKQGDAFILYSIAPTNFGGDTKNFVRMSATRRDLERTIRDLLK